MNKLRLDLDTLHVQSFATSAAKGGDRGTVRGHSVYEEDNAKLTTTNVSDWDCFSYSCFCSRQDHCSQGCTNEA